MAPDLSYRLDTATAEQIAVHLAGCDGLFVPRLSGRVDISIYSAKLAGHARRFEAWSDASLVGLVAVYLSAQPPRAFVSNVSVLPSWNGRGIGRTLMQRCIEAARAAGAHEVALEVDRQNAAALKLYGDAGFTALPASGSTLPMTLSLRSQS